MQESVTPHQFLLLRNLFHVLKNKFGEGWGNKSVTLGIADM